MQADLQGRIYLGEGKSDDAIASESIHHCVATWNICSKDKAVKEK